jgi:hypothetical protein
MPASLSCHLCPDAAPPLHRMGVYSCGRLVWDGVQCMANPRALDPRYPQKVNRMPHCWTSFCNDTATTAEVEDCTPAAWQTRRLSALAHRH